ncbi:MAG: aldo/keto reductase [Candidatus Latescibacteria bacterium]|nr:aldo/keto reductase [Candidatus Latescibacterota bacterium]
MPELERRTLGRTGMRPRALGLGCAYFGTKDVSDDEAVAAIRHAIDLGLDCIDTSPLYGESERRVGLALSGGLRQKVYLQTKVGLHPDRRHDYSSEAIRWSLENSLRLLRTDRLDSALIHAGRDIEDASDLLGALDELLVMREEGLLDHIGIGVRSQEILLRAMETGHIEIALTFLDYNLLTQSAADTIFPAAREHNVGLILASALGSGILAGPEPDPDVEGDRIPGQEPRARAMWAWCRDRDVNIRHLAMQFCLAAPVDGIVMPGPANVQQVQEAYEAAVVDVPPEVWRDFEAAFGVGIGDCGANESADSSQP